MQPKKKVKGDSSSASKSKYEAIYKKIRAANVQNEAHPF